MRKLLGDFVSVIRELSLDELRDEAQLAPAILIVGEHADGERLVRQLFGPAGLTVTTFADQVPGAESERFDLAFCLWAGGPVTPLERTVQAARRRGWPVVVVGTSPSASASPLPAIDFLPLGGPAVDWAAAQRWLAGPIEENRLIAFGRHLPATRPMVAAALVQLTAKANAQFATLSSLPALIPLLGNLVGAAGDFLVLTKNQLLLLYKLAAVFGRDIDDRRQLYLEMVPVVGAGLLWRTVARELIGLMPGLLGAVPKIAVAYTGTYVVGRAAQFYYEEGRRPTRADWDRFYQQALEWLARFRQSLDGQRAGQPAPDSAPVKVEISRPEPSTTSSVH